MVQKDLAGVLNTSSHLRVIRHANICEKLQVSSAKLFDMIARGQFPKPFTLVPNGRAVGWLEYEVDQWILDRKSAAQQGGV